MIRSRSASGRRGRELAVVDGDLDRKTGIREFVVGTGGASRYALPSGTRPDNLVAA